MHAFSLGCHGGEGLCERNFLPGYPEALTGVESLVPEAGRAPPGSFSLWGFTVRASFLPGLGFKVLILRQGREAGHEHYPKKGIVCVCVCVLVHTCIHTRAHTYVHMWVWLQSWDDIPKALESPLLEFKCPASQRSKGRRREPALCSFHSTDKPQPQKGAGSCWDAVEISLGKSHKPVRNLTSFAFSDWITDRFWFSPFPLQR